MGLWIVTRAGMPDTAVEAAKYTIGSDGSLAFVGETSDASLCAFAAGHWHSVVVPPHLAPQTLKGLQDWIADGQRIPGPLRQIHPNPIGRGGLGGR